MEFRWILALLVAFVLGGFFVWLALDSGDDGDETLVDGKYLVFETDHGHWVYERTDTGFLPVLGKYTFSTDYGNWVYERTESGLNQELKDFSPLGLRSIWEVQRDYKPAELATEKGPIVYVPATQYSSETGSFNVNYVFYEYREGKLVEIPLERAPRPPR